MLSCVAEGLPARGRSGRWEVERVQLAGEGLDVINLQFAAVATLIDRFGKS